MNNHQETAKTSKQRKNERKRIEKELKKQAEIVRKLNCQNYETQVNFDLKHPPQTSQVPLSNLIVPKQQKIDLKQQKQNKNKNNAETSDTCKNIIKVKSKEEIDAEKQQATEKRKKKNRKREEQRKKKRQVKALVELISREQKRKKRKKELFKKNKAQKKSEDGLHWNVQNMMMIQQRQLELQNQSYLRLNQPYNFLYLPFDQHQLIPQSVFNFYPQPVQQFHQQIIPQIQCEIPGSPDDEDQPKLQSEEDEIEKQKRFDDYRQKLFDLQIEKKQRQALFSRIETFRAGTFRYIRNKFYQPDEKLAYEEAERDYSLQQSNIAGNSVSQLQIRTQQIEQLKALRQPQVKFFKQFQPIFPFMYLSIDKGQEIGHQRSLFLSGKHIYEPERNLYDKKQVNLSVSPIQNPELIHSKLQFKFSIRRNLLLNYEESRTEQIEKQKLIMNTHLKKGKDFFVDYILNLDFTNIKKIWIWREPIKQSHSSQEEQKIQLTLMIQLKKPCQAIKIEPELIDEEILKNPESKNSQSNIEQKDEAQENQETNHKKKFKLYQIRSPFNMLNNQEDEINFEKLIYNQNHEQVWENNIGLTRKRAEYGTLLNYWNNQQVLFFEGESTQSGLNTFIDSLKKINQLVKIYNTKQDSQNFVGPMQDHKLLPIQIKDFAQMTKEIYEMRDQALNFTYQLNKMMPCIRYAFMALLSQKKVNIFNTGLVKFMQKINNGGWSKTQAQADFCAYLIDQINLFEDLDFREDNEDQLQKFFEKLTGSKSVIEDYKIQKNSKNNIFQRRCLVTPTILYFTVARVEESNKVLRQNRANVSRFIRVSFVTEQLDKGFYQNDFYHLYLGYIHSFLKNGFFVGNSCKQVFLNYSNSQLKNHTCWFLSIQPPNLFPQTQQLTVQQIIKDQGEFDEEKNILKRYARRGQCFSTTKNIQMLSSSQVFLNYPDIERNGYCFSDGCGWIHPDLAKEISVKYNLSNISAFQIRLGGAKGILAINENLELFKSQSQNEPYKVLLRKSQIKFPSNNLSLDVIRCATFSQGYLNRQVILLLHCLGVPSEYFLKKQEQAKQLLNLKDNLEKIDLKIKKIRQKFGTVLTQDFDDQFQIINGQVVDLNEQQKLEFTISKNQQLQSLAKQIKLAVEPCRTFQAHFRQALIKGMEVLKEPTFSNIMHCMQLNQMLNLKKKARIILPDSCVLIGIIDPSGLLEENQIFFQIRKDSFSKHKKGSDEQQMCQAEMLNNIENIQQIVEGKVLVTRNPCNHPGDIRLLNSVDCLELRHLFNVIVFSSKGDRPQSSMMSGGDLDGDTYLIMWEKELINYINPQNIFEPADYSKSNLIKEKPASDDLADYFVFYLQRDVLGVVSNLWLLLTDMNGQYGPLNPECKDLAQMCSVAVDFAKHGECVSSENFQKQKSLVAKHHPDFLERHDQFGLTTINSNGVLGKLYRESCNQEALMEFFRADFENSILCEYELDQKILGLAPEFINKSDEQLGYDSEDNQEVNQRQRMHFYLQILYEQIVQPMTQHLKRIMITFQLASEGELFAADLKFRLCHISNQQVFFGQEDKQIYLGDTGSKTEDAIKNLNNQRNKVVEQYSNKFKEIASQFENQDKNVWINLSVALYLATYFDGNKSGLKYYQKMKSDHNFESFLLLKKRLQDQTTSDLIDLQKKLKEDFKFFQIFSAESEQGDLKKLRQLLDCKKLFSIPWLLAGEIILKYYPDNYENQEYLKELTRMKIMQQRPVRSRSGQTFSSQQIACQQINNLSEDQYLTSIFGNFQTLNEAQPQFEMKNERPVNKLTQPPRLELKQQTFLELIYQTFDQYHYQKQKELQRVS